MIVCLHLLAKTNKLVRQTESNSARGEALNTTTNKLLHLSCHFSLFLTVSLLLSVVLWPEEGDFPENLHRVVCVIINKHSFESFLCLDLILER